MDSWSSPVNQTGLLDEPSSGQWVIMPQNRKQKVPEEGHQNVSSGNHIQAHVYVSEPTGTCTHIHKFHEVVANHNTQSKALLRYYGI